MNLTTLRRRRIKIYNIQMESLDGLGSPSAISSRTGPTAEFPTLTRPLR
jgi:hypothetical protein